jgi:hypothetical protein
LDWTYLLKIKKATTGWAGKATSWKPPPPASRGRHPLKQSSGPNTRAEVGEKGACDGVLAEEPTDEKEASEGTVLLGEGRGEEGDRAQSGIEWHIYWVKAYIITKHDKIAKYTLHLSMQSIQLIHKHPAYCVQEHQKHRLWAGL